MNILTIDVTCDKLVVAGFNGKKIEYKISNESGKKHNSLVIPYIDEILTKMRLDIADIDVFSCVVGPGSFTGIRIGIATMKALSFATNKKTIAINALEELAYGKTGTFYTMIDALHGNCYAAKFDGSWENMKDVTCCSYDDIKATGIEAYLKDSESAPEKLIEITLNKANKGQFEALEPLYLRKSQAERDKDGE